MDQYELYIYIYNRPDDIYIKRPDGVTIIPWKTGRTLVWDATCTDTFAASHLTLAAREARAVAALAEERKRAKYLDLAQTHHFVAVVVETTGAMGTDALDFFFCRRWKPSQGGF